MERMIKEEELKVKYNIIRELEKAINEIELTVGEDKKELLFRLHSARVLLMNYYMDERR